MGVRYSINNGVINSCRFELMVPLQNKWVIDEWNLNRSDKIREKRETLCESCYAAYARTHFNTAMLTYIRIKISFYCIVPATVVCYIMNEILIVFQKYPCYDWMKDWIIDGKHVNRIYFNRIVNSFIVISYSRINYRISKLLKKNFFSLLVLEGVIIESRTEPRSRISLLLVNNFLLLTSG
jgi:hypothetical protein